MRARAPAGLMVSRFRTGTRTMNDAFEWVGFALQAPGAIAECLDAAGIDAGVPCHGRDDDAPRGD